LLVLVHGEGDAVEEGSRTICLVQLLHVQDVRHRAFSDVIASRRMYTRGGAGCEGGGDGDRVRRWRRIGSDGGRRLEAADGEGSGGDGWKGIGSAESGGSAGGGRRLKSRQRRPEVR